MDGMELFLQSQYYGEIEVHDHRIILIVLREQLAVEIQSISGCS